MIAKIKDFFSREDINTGRQVNIDIAKTLAMVFMILIHVMMYPLYKNLQTPFGIITGSFLGSFLAAPVFMISMGITVSFSRNSTPKGMLKRGLNLLILSYVVNIVRAIVPVTAYLIMGKGAELLVFFFCIGDILQFAGLAFILLGLLKMIKKHTALWIILVGVVLNLCVSFIPTIYSDSYAIGYTVGLIYPIVPKTINNLEMCCCFPLASWFIYVAFGYLFGIVMRKAKNLNKFYLISGIIGAVLFAGFFTLDYLTGISMAKVSDFNSFCGELNCEYYNYIVFALFSIGSTLVEYCLFHYLSKITPQKFNKIVFTLSDALNQIYIISWIVILDFEYFFFGILWPNDNYGVWLFLIWFVATFAISAPLGILWNKKKKAKAKKLAAQTN